jgi:8-amino-7-oxononanoate synthase
VRRNPQSTSGLVDLASDDYLGLAGDPRLAAAAIAAIERFGTSARASRVVTGTTAAHEELEAELCNLTGQPSALVFSSGYTANVGILTALDDPDTLLVCDKRIHASPIDGARLSRFPVQVADLETLAAICERFDALLVVYEGHGVGVAGAGRGAVSAAGLTGAEHIVMTATMSKALGS